MEATMTVRTERVDATDVYLRTTAVIFAAAVLVHGSDHVRRGLDASPTAVMIAGSIQAVVVLIAVVLVFRRTRWAPHAAIVVDSPAPPCSYTRTCCPRTRTCSPASGPSVTASC